MVKALLQCGECDHFIPSDFEEEGSLKIGHCCLFPGGETRRFNDGPCGIWPMILKIMEGLNNAREQV